MNDTFLFVVIFCTIILDGYARTDTRMFRIILPKLLRDVNYSVCKRMEFLDDRPKIKFSVSFLSVIKSRKHFVRRKNRKQISASLTIKCRHHTHRLKQKQLLHKRIWSILQCYSPIITSHFPPCSSQHTHLVFTVLGFTHLIFRQCIFLPVRSREGT